MIIALVLGVPLAAVGAWYASDWLNAPNKKPANLQIVKPHPARLVVEPERIELGRRSQCEGLVTVRGSLRNASDEPAVLADWVLGCGCTSPSGTLERGMTIAPGEVVEFEVASDAWATAGEKNYHIDFVEQAALRPVRMTLRYIVESPLHSDVGMLTASTHGTSEFHVLSKDNEAFRIVSAEPPIVRFDAEATATKHKIVVDWAKAASILGVMTRDAELRIRTDRQDCPELFLRILPPPS